MTPADAATLFRALADRLDAVADPATFGGAFLVVPPGADGIEPLVLDGLHVTTTPNIAVFWTGVSGQVAMAVDMAGNQARGQQPAWGRR
jgi:hypothetical protein